VAFGEPCASTPLQRIVALTVGELRDTPSSPRASVMSIPDIFVMALELKVIYILL
jgi:hypothetical protein